MDSYHAGRVTTTLDPEAYEELHQAMNRQRWEAWDGLYESYGLSRITYGNLSFVAARESRRLLGLVLDSTGRDFSIAAGGLGVSTIASVLSLFLP